MKFKLKIKKKQNKIQRRKEARPPSLAGGVVSFLLHITGLFTLRPR
jgi:hypothetical protein